MSICISIFPAAPARYVYTVAGVQMASNGSRRWLEKKRMK